MRGDLGEGLLLGNGGGTAPILSGGDEVTRVDRWSLSSPTLSSPRALTGYHSTWLTGNDVDWVDDAFAALIFCGRSAGKPYHRMLDQYDLSHAWWTGTSDGADPVPVEAQSWGPQHCICIWRIWRIWRPNNQQRDCACSRQGDGDRCLGNISEAASE
ncbi:hypothetical protein PG993_006307 [Apiospora rasikravindrae]|uniref:Uncharacterized protein n=1 Tax=Apiospora rasikravindrae TaxID=990691 RepID=A0ABR1T5C4_9PEZI